MPTSKLKRTIIQDFLKEKQRENNEWHCCNSTFVSITDIGRHVNKSHQADMDAREAHKTEEKQEKQEKQNNLHLLKQRRGKKGSSDPITIECQCQLQDSKVILFYKYTLIKDPVKFALDHQHYCANMTGKIRIASEGINATLAGSNQEIDQYLQWLTSTHPFDDDDLKQPKSLQLNDASTLGYKFFKPSPGCRHVFSELSIKLVDEICPLGQTTVVLDKLQNPDHNHGKLSPSDFHDMILSKRHEDDYVLLDTRNYYESKIGHFEGAIQPPIRKFSQFPDYVERNKDAMRGKTILAYCTGGIRCEKATAFMRQALPDQDIFMLDGGIHNYMEWWKHKKDDTEDDRVWQGKNYVFDARQSLGLNDKGRVVSHCQKCNQPWDKYKKCESMTCHLLVLCCDTCCLSNEHVYCCEDCQRGQQNGLCACEKERRRRELGKLL